MAYLLCGLVQNKALIAATAYLITMTHSRHPDISAAGFTRYNQSTICNNNNTLSTQI